TNVLELRLGSTINGAVLNGALGNNTLKLGGSSNSSFDTTVLGAGFNAFNAFEKTGTSTWTLSGTPSQATPWTISQGTLAISSDSNLGNASGGLIFNGGTLQVTTSFSSARGITLQSGGGTIDSTSGTLALSGNITGAGGLTFTPNSLAILLGNNN